MRRSAFTILEVSLVLAVLIVAAAIALPSIDAMYGGLRLTAASDMIRAHWAEARARAIDDGVPYRFAVTYGTGNLKVAPDTSEFWSGGSGSATTPPEGESPPLVVEDTLPKSVLFVDEGAGGDSESGDWSSVVTFLPAGTANRDIVIALREGNGRPLIVRLRALNCAVTVQRSSEGR